MYFEGGSGVVLSACLTVSFNTKDNQIVTKFIDTKVMSLRRVCHFPGQRMGLNGRLC